MRPKSLNKNRNTKIKTAFAVFIFCALLFPVFNLKATSLDSVEPRRTSYKLNLISAREQIPGSFTTTQSLYSDEFRIYLASAQGTLFVLHRSRQENFPLLESINLNSLLTAVIASNSKLYVASANGSVYIFEIPKSYEGNLRKLETKLVNNYGVNSLAIAKDGSIIAGLGQGRVAISGDYVFVSGLNEGDDAIMLGKNRGFEFKINTKATDVYRISSGEYVGTISNYFSGAVSILATHNMVYMTKPGCCGTGVAVYDPDSRENIDMIAVRYANDLARKDNFTIFGTEAGTVDLVLGTQTINTVDLRKLTNHTGLEDIEIRALWADSHDNYVFAASSWGNDISRSNTLPSFFVLELANSEQFGVDSGQNETTQISISEEVVNRTGDIASGILSIQAAQASEIDAIQNETNTSSDQTGQLESKTEKSFFVRLFANIAKAFKFLFGKIA